MGTFERLYLVLKQTLRGSATPSSLKGALTSQSAELLAQLPLRPRDPSALQRVLDDPMFSHCSVHLEPLGRLVVVQLSDELHVSELLCWELLLAASASVTSASTPAALKQAERLCCFELPWSLSPSRGSPSSLLLSSPLPSSPIPSRPLPARPFPSSPCHGALNPGNPPPYTSTPELLLFSRNRNLTIFSARRSITSLALHLRADCSGRLL